MTRYHTCLHKTQRQKFASGLSNKLQTEIDTTLIMICSEADAISEGRVKANKVVQEVTVSLRYWSGWDLAQVVNLVTGH